MDDEWIKMARDYCISYDEMFIFDDKNNLYIPEEKFPEVFAWYKNHKLLISSLVGVPLDDINFDEGWTLEQKNCKAMQLNMLAMIAKKKLAIF